MAEAVLGKISETVEEGSKEVQENATEAVGNVVESVEGVADEGKEKAEEKVAETKKSFTSLFSHGLSKAEKLVNTSREYVDSKGTDLQAKMGQVSDSLASLVKKVPGGSGEKKSEEADSLPVSDKDGGGSSSSSPAVATDRDLPEKQPLLTATTGTQTSWTNCCGLFDCLTSSDR